MRRHFDEPETRAVLEAALKTGKRLKPAQVAAYVRIRGKGDPILQALANAIDPTVRGKPGRPKTGERLGTKTLITHARTFHEPLLDYAIRFIRPRKMAGPQKDRGNAYKLFLPAEFRKQAIVVRHYEHTQSDLHAAGMELTRLIRKGRALDWKDFITLAERHNLPQPAPFCDVKTHKFTHYGSVETREISYDKNQPEWELSLSDIYDNIRLLGPSDDRVGASNRTYRYLHRLLGISRATISRWRTEVLRRRRLNRRRLS